MQILEFLSEITKEILLLNFSGQVDVTMYFSNEETLAARFTNLSAAKPAISPPVKDASWQQYLAEYHQRLIDEAQLALRSVQSYKKGHSIPLDTPELISPAMPG